jgi:hypothetical protein
MVDKLIFKIDGMEATFEDEKQIKAVNYLLEKNKEWKITANTYRKAIDLIFKEASKDGQLC